MTFYTPVNASFWRLMEAAVKSVKYHLKRCISKQLLTYEEMTTFLCRIACMNSKPIAAISNNLGY